MVTKDGMRQDKQVGDQQEVAMERDYINQIKKELSDVTIDQAKKIQEFVTSLALST